MDRLRIAFVDDEPDLLASLRRALHHSANSHGWDLAFYTDPRTALADLRRAPAAVAVIDLMMPGMNGLDLAEALQATAPGTVIIILSGCAELQMAVGAINRAAAFRYFVKPASIEELVGGIRDAAAHWLARAATSNGHGLSGPQGAEAMALDLLAFGIFVSDSHGRVEVANRHAGELLSAEGGLVVDRDGVMRVNDRKAQAKLQAARHSASNAGRMSAVALDSLDPPLHILVMPSPDPARLIHFVTRVGHGPTFPAGLIADLLDLSPSEARLVGRLAEGRTLEDAAMECGITKSTARSYLKQVFLKTGVSRQTELLRLLMISLASVEITSLGKEHL